MLGGAPCVCVCHIGAVAITRLPAIAIASAKVRTVGPPAYPCALTIPKWSVMFWGYARGGVKLVSGVINFEPAGAEHWLSSSLSC